MSDRLAASDLPRPQQRVSDEDRVLSRRQAFLDMLESVPLDNRRRGEGFKATFIDDDGRPKPPRENVPFLHGSPDAICKIAESHLRDCYPVDFDQHGHQTVRLALLNRLTDMERIRREGRPRKRGATTAGTWNPAE